MIIDTIHKLSTCISHCSQQGHSTSHITQDIHNISNVTPSVLSAMTGSHLIARESDKLQQLERPRGQHGNHLQEVDKQWNETLAAESQQPFILNTIPGVSEEIILTPNHTVQV